MPYSRKRSLSGIGLETMMPGIEFGSEATVAVFDRMYAAARGMDHDKIVVGNVTAQEVVQAIDTLLPVTSGVRRASDKLSFDNLAEDIINRDPAFILAEIQGEVWMKFHDELPSFLGVKPEDVWLAIQHMEYLGTCEPVEPTPEKITVAGKDFVSQGCHVKIHSAAGTPIGELFEMTSTHAVLPQYFARMEDGDLRDLRNDNYSVYDPEDEVQIELDETPSPG